MSETIFRDWDGIWIWFLTLNSQDWSRYWGTDMNKTVSFLGSSLPREGRQTTKPAVCYVSSLGIQTKFAHLDVFGVCVITHTFYTFTHKFVLAFMNITGFSLFSGFSKILTIGFQGGATPNNLPANARSSLWVPPCPSPVQVQALKISVRQSQPLYPQV